MLGDLQKRHSNMEDFIIPLFCNSGPHIYTYINTYIHTYTLTPNSFEAEFAAQLFQERQRKRQLHTYALRVAGVNQLQ